LSPRQPIRPCASPIQKIWIFEYFGAPVTNCDRETTSLSVTLWDSPLPAFILTTQASLFPSDFQSAPFRTRHNNERFNLFNFSKDYQTHIIGVSLILLGETKKFAKTFIKPSKPVFDTFYTPFAVRNEPDPVLR